MSLSAQRLQQYFRTTESDQGKTSKQAKEQPSGSRDRITNPTGPLLKQKEPTLHHDRQEYSADKAPFDQHKSNAKKNIAHQDGPIDSTKLNSGPLAAPSIAASASILQRPGSSIASDGRSTTLIPEKWYLAIQKTEKGRESLENFTNMRLTHYLDIFQRKLPCADAQFLSYVCVNEMRNKIWWQVTRDDNGRVTLSAFKSWIAKHEPLYLPSFDVALKLHLHCKDVMSSEADILPHLINLIFAKLCVDLSKRLLQPRQMRRILLDDVGGHNAAYLYPLILEFSGLEDAEIPDEGAIADPTIEGMVICADFVTDLEDYFCRKTEGELAGADARELEQNLAMKASLNWFSEAQDDVDARRFAMFATQSKEGVMSEKSATQQTQANESSSEDSDEPEPTKIKEFDLKSFSATAEMRQLMTLTNSKSSTIKSPPKGSVKAKDIVAKSSPVSESDSKIMEGLQMHKKVEWERALRTYTEFCLRKSCGLLRFLVEHGMTTTCRGCSQQISALGFEGMNVLFSYWPYFTDIDISDNNLQDAGVITLSNNLTSMVNMHHFNLSNNCIQTTCTAELEKIILSFPDLQSFNISKNHLGDYAASVVVSALKGCKSLTSVDLHSTHAGLKSGMMLGQMIPICKKISVLNLAWNQLRGAGGSALLLNGVLGSQSIQKLDLSWNGFGDNDCSSAIAKVLAANTVLQSLDLRYNRLNSDSCSFIAPGVKKNTTLSYLNLSNNPVGDNGSRIIYKAAAQSEEIMKLKGDHHERALLMNNCGLGISQNDQFDPADPAGKYTLDMSETKSQNVLLSLFHLVASGSGAFTAGSCKLDDQHISISLRGDWESEPTYTDGILEFEFENLRCKPKAKNVVPDSEVAMIVKLLQDASETNKMSLMDMLLLGDTFLSLKQCLLLLSHLKDSVLRVNFVQKATNKLFEATMAQELVNALSEEDNLILQSRMSDASKNFHPNSVNGFYKLQLGKDCDRNIFYALCERRNRWKMSTNLILREPIEFCFMNMKYNKTPMEFKPSWRCPKEGVLEFDYCDQERSLPTDPVLSSLEKLRELILVGQDESEIVKNLRKVTGEFFLMAFCAKELLYSLKTKQFRVEAFIIMMPKIYDFCACGPLWFSLSQEESQIVENRMGLHNLFHFSWAVKYWELDLANNVYHRYVLAVLVDLAVIEPGENMVDVRLNGLCFEVPAAWVKAIPSKGFFTVHYCRSKDVIQDIITNIPSHWANPDSDWVKSQPYDTEWVDWSMRFRIRNKLAASFKTPAEGFAVMDEDGGGSLSRQEISRGLRKLGVFLAPQEIDLLLECLDEDGGGDVDLEELESFWEKTLIPYSQKDPQYKFSDIYSSFKPDPETNSIWWLKEEDSMRGLRLHACQGTFDYTKRYKDDD